MKIYFSVLILVFLMSCVPQSQEQQPVLGQETNIQETDTTIPMTKEDLSKSLLGAMLNVPNTNVAIRVDRSLLSGTLTDLQSNPKGTLQLSTGQALRLADTPYIVLPALVRFVTGGGGVYLFLLEQDAETFTQQQVIYLGKDIELLALEYVGNRLVSNAINLRLGKPPFNVRTLEPGRRFFELQDGQLQEVKP
ncbi:MAG: hypothetical protein ACRCYY_21110 [Trueperaceae bacterium]